MVASDQPTLALAERVASAARELGIETAVIGAIALAAHNYIRGTLDVDLATRVEHIEDLRRLQQKLVALGLETELRTPDDEDPLGGVLEVWEREGDEDTPINPVEVVNFFNPYRPEHNPGTAAVRNATPIEGSSLRYVQLADLIALKLYTGALRDRADVVELLTRNPDADRDAIRAACAPFGLGESLEQLLLEADRITSADG